MLYSYVLIGFKGDTIEKAQKRLYQTIDAGFIPMAMLYRDYEGKFDKTWKRFQREWANPTIRAVKINEYEVNIKHKAI
ncbi:hypothetical protein Barb6_02816 [Bacteroidales bacterium Barb6]|nr:hypothetical protein Barb6_02816 [Bacteroidales bacterium Barb6]